MVQGREGALGSHIKSFHVEARHCMTAIARGRPGGETEAAERRFWARVGFAWRHFCGDAPGAALACHEAMDMLLERRTGGRGERSLVAAQACAPPGLEHPQIDHPNPRRAWIENGPRETVVTTTGPGCTSTFPGGVVGADPEAMPVEGPSLKQCDSSRAPSRTLRAHLSDESTCAKSSAKDEEEDEVEDERSSTADMEEWEPNTTRRHSKRSRKGRRAKAKARRTMWMHAKQQAYCESREGENLNSSLLGALLTAIAEDDPLEGDFGSDNVSSTSPEDDGSRQSGVVQVMTEEPIAKQSRLEERGETVDDEIARREALGTHPGTYSGTYAGSEASSAESDWSEIDSNADLLEHEKLEDLKEGATVLPASLVWALVRVQDAADKWRGDEDDRKVQNGDKSEILQGLGELRHKLKRVKAMARHPADLDSFCFRRPWAELQEWIRDGDGGAEYHMLKIDELVEEAKDQEEELDEDWLKDEFQLRCASIQDSWEQVFEHLVAFEKAVARLEYIEQRQAAEDVSIQATINARLAKSLVSRHPSSFG